MAGVSEPLGLQRFLVPYPGLCTLTCMFMRCLHRVAWLCSGLPGAGGVGWGGFAVGVPTLEQVKGGVGASAFGGSLVCGVSSWVE